MSSHSWHLEGKDMGELLSRRLDISRGDHWGFFFFFTRKKQWKGLPDIWFWCWFSNHMYNVLVHVQQKAACTSADNSIVSSAYKNALKFAGLFLLIFQTFYCWTREADASTGFGTLIEHQKSSSVCIDRSASLKNKWPISFLCSEFATICDLVSLIDIVWFIKERFLKNQEIKVI